jgi:ribonucleoside-diphosphate reductase beta chain
MSNIKEEKNINGNLLKTTDPRSVFKPFRFPWAIEACETQHKMHWIPTEVDLLADLHEFNYVLNDKERNVITQILRFFTQADLEVGRAYIDYYLRIFKCPEIRMMLASFASMETVHVLAYSYLITSLRLPDTEYNAFLEYQEMTAKYDYMQSFSIDDPFSIALTLAIVSGFIEGMTLFASFAILMYFPVLRGQLSRSCFHGVGQIVSFSIRDETLHCMSIIKLFHEYLKENAHLIDQEKLKLEIYRNCDILLNYEFAFIDLALKDGDLDYLKAEDLKKYIKYLADLRLGQLGLKPIYNTPENPLPWTSAFLFPKELTNFFEMTPTNYTKGDFALSEEINWDIYR